MKKTWNKILVNYFSTTHYQLSHREIRLPTIRLQKGSQAYGGLHKANEKEIYFMKLIGGQ